MARPKTWNDEFIKKVREDMLEYIEAHDIPVISQFAWKYGYPRAKLYIEDGVADLVEYMQAKKESALEILALYGDVNHTMAIFSLKQMGWKDRHETDNKHSVTERKIVYENEDDDSDGEV